MDDSGAHRRLALAPLIRPPVPDAGSFSSRIRDLCLAVKLRRLEMGVSPAAAATGATTTRPYSVVSEVVFVAESGRVRPERMFESIGFNSRKFFFPANPWRFASGPLPPLKVSSGYLSRGRALRRCVRARRRGGVAHGPVSAGSRRETRQTVDA